MAYRKAAALLLVALFLPSCDKSATGQVAAVVNDEEITLQEVNAELGSAQAGDASDKKAIQSAALQRVVERRLMAQIAREEGLDKTPEFLLRERQLHDALLVQLLGQKAERALAVPDAAAIDKYIADNPVAFNARKIFTIDRIQFAMPKDPDRLKVLESDHSMEAVASRLGQLGIEFRRENALVDSAQLGQERLQQIQALPEGEPFVVPERGVVTVGVITGERDAPVSPADARPLAVRAIRNERLGETLRQRLKQARAKAQIEYQPGFAVVEPKTQTPK